MSTLAFKRKDNKTMHCLSSASYRRVILFFLCLSLFLGAVAKADGDYAIVTNAQVSEKALSSNSLRSIFGMQKKTWADGAKIRVFVLPDDDLLHQVVSKEKLNVFPYQLRSTWDRLIFSGTGQAPIQVNSIEEMLTKVATTPGAIGYLWKVNINENVNVLQIK